MHKIASILAVSALALALAACGGSDDKSFVGSSSSSSSESSSSSGSSSSGSSSSSAAATVSTITLIASAPQIPSDNSKPVTITAILKNSSNAVVTGIPVTFGASSGAIAPTSTNPNVVAGTSDDNGEAEASLTTPGDPSNRNVSVTATVGTVSASLTIAVVGTKLTVSGPTSLIQGAMGTFSVSLTDSSGAGIAGQTVSVSSATGNTLSSSSLTTDSSGHATFTLTGKNAGTDTVSAAALGLTSTQSVSVSSQSFNVTTPAANANININTPQTVTVVWTNNGAPVAGQMVTITTTRGLFSGSPSTTVTTDGAGTATATISSATAGPAVISASASGVSAQVSAEFIATTPASIDVQASPATIQTSAQSTITAIVWDAQNNLVEGQTVDFQLTDKTGGTISVASAITDAQGRAQTVYTATSTPSSSSGVSVTATVQGTAIQGSATLTVGGQTVFLSMGTGNTIQQLPAGCGSGAGQTPCTQFSMPFSIQALDSSGNAVPGVSISLSVHSFPQVDVPPPLNADGSTSSTYAAYAKGFWQTCSGTPGVAWCQAINATCYNEDEDGSGILKLANEDINGNGKLDPGDVASVSPGSVTTDSNGSANVSVIYPQDHALWVQVRLTASATVSGTESSTSSTFWLPILASDISSSSTVPPGVNSPYGIANACTNPN